MEYILLGGIFIWPIVLESILALLVIIERILFFVFVLPRKHRALSKLLNLSWEGESNWDVPHELGELVEAMKRAHEQRSLHLSLLAVHAEKLINEVERYLTILNVVAQTAPLFGLLGTVTGMIKLFMSIESQSLAGLPITPSSLAGGIWEALITTAAGLIVGIPALIAFVLFNRLVDRFAGEVDAFLSEIAHRASLLGWEVV